jgi:photosystem II stability/assembly factor-like uncharacterized protein
MRRLGFFLLGVGALLGASATAQTFDPSLYSDLRWRLVGPFRGGWATCAEGTADDPTTYYFGAAAGGVWKTEDAGRTWNPIFDKAGSASVGAIAIAPSNPKVIYVGTGQIQARYDIASGDGVYRSDDAGKSWKHVGLGSTRAIGRILVDPRNPDVVLVAALGHIFGPNRERGVFRTEDGGKTWNPVLFVSENTGGADLAADPENPAIVYASLWQARNYPWLSYFKPMVGPESGLYKSTDGGKTWKRISGGGWPEGNLGRIGLGASPGGRVWALVDAAPPASREEEESPAAGLHRSDDGGATWTHVNASPGLGSSYMNRVTPDPKNRDVVYVTGQSIRRSDDGGKTLQFFRGAPGGDDYHFLWINPKRPEYMVTAADQGTIVSVNGGKSWSGWYNQPTGQFYHVETNDQFPYWIYGGQQDSGTAGAASRSDFGSLTFRDWHPVGGEERGWDVPDPRDPAIVYGTGLGGTITRFDSRTAQVRNVSPAAESTYGRRPVAGLYRWSWVFPIAMSPKSPYALYTGSQYLLRSQDEGTSWEKASPDLSGAESSAKGCDGDLTLDVARSCGYGVIFTITLSPRDPQEIWVGTDDGFVQMTRDGGKTWKNVTPKTLPAWTKVSTIDVTSLEAGVAYVAADGHRRDDFTQRAYRTRDYGATWQEIAAGLPNPGFTMAVRADPVKRGLLYAGTDTGVFVSFDDGGRWQSLRSNLPTCWVGDLKVKGDDLVIATQGRGFWVLDDVSPLRQISSEVAGASSFLFAPASAVRVRANMNRDTPLPPETPAGKNPPPGASIDYVLGKKAASVKIEILDDKGRAVRTFASDDPPEKLHARRYFTDLYVHPPAPPSVEPGHHRIQWDLRYPRPRADHYEYSIAAIAGEDAPIEPRGPLALPGRYTVRLTVDGQAAEKPLTVTMDPRVKVTDAALAERLAFEQQVGATMGESYDALQSVRALRKDLEARRTKASGAAADALREADAAAKKVESGEARGGGLGGVNALLSSLLPGVEGADAPPTTIQTQAADGARAKLVRLLEDWKKLQATGVQRVNATLRAAGIEEVAVGAGEGEPEVSDEREGVEIE